MLLRPARLQKGNTIGLIAPAADATPEWIAPAVAGLEGEGFRVKFGANLFSHTEGYGGSIRERADDFNAMVADEEVGMILFGGGEIANEILPYIDYEAIRRHPKIISSYSDGTSILDAVQYMTGLVTFYGASPRTFASLTDYNRASFTDRLIRPTKRHLSAEPWKTIRGGSACGRLTGGYLVNYAAMQGLPWYSPKRDEPTVLFLEDHERYSSLSVVSKWFSMLEQRGGFENVTGLLFGHYAGHPEPGLDRILARIGDTYGIPVAKCEDFGHGENNAVIPIGIRAELNADAGTLTYLEDGVL